MMGGGGTLGWLTPSCKTRAVRMSFESNLAKVEQTLRRALTQEERRLLKLWELTSQSSRNEREQDIDAPVAPLDQATYSGRFKVLATKGHYEVYFVCAKVTLRPVEVGDREGVMEFLSQDPVLLDEMFIKQALAAADIGRPTMINIEVTLSEPLLRSMGFQKC